MYSIGVHITLKTATKPDFTVTVFISIYMVWFLFLNIYLATLNASLVFATLLCNKFKQEAQGFGALLNKMEDNGHIKLDNIEI